MVELDHLVRLRTFEFLRAATRRFDRGEIPWSVLLAGFEFEGRRVPLVSMQGIFKPAILRDAPLTIRTTAEDPTGRRPYEDEIRHDGTISYCYRRGARGNADNDLLRCALRERRPLAYLFGVAEGLYVAAWPAFIVADDSKAGTVLVQLADAVELDSRAAQPVVKEPWFDERPAADLHRRYVTVEAQKRLHQGAFRQRVLAAYQRRCAICSLKRTELLDAAHIIPDREPGGLPVVPNGMSLCELHHRAFDLHLLTVRPDLKVVVRADVLEEEDGPMLVHGLQRFHEQPIGVPRRTELRPDRDRLEQRYAMFRSAAGA